MTRTPYLTSEMAPLSELHVTCTQHLNKEEFMLSAPSRGLNVELHMLWFKFTSGLNFFKLVHIFQTGLYFSNWFIFVKPVYIFQTGSYFSNWFIFFKLG